MIDLSERGQGNIGNTPIKILIFQIVVKTGPTVSSRAILRRNFM
jgi:hypothetical protein